MAALATDDEQAGRSRVGIHPNKEICCSEKYIANSIETQKIDIEIFFSRFSQKKSVGSAVKNRVGRVTVNKAFFSFGLSLISPNLKNHVSNEEQFFVKLSHSNYIKTFNSTILSFRVRFPHDVS